MFGAFSVAVGAVAYLFFANHGASRIVGWIGEEAKPSVNDRSPYLLKLEPIRIDSNGWTEAMKRKA